MRGKTWTLERRRAASELRKGNKGSNWIDGRNALRKQRYLSFEYKFWRTSVFKRDNYTCQNCGQRGGSLQADHIKPVALFPELQFELTNGRTLCVKCHRKTPTYGGKLTRLMKQVDLKTLKNYIELLCLA